MLAESTANTRNGPRLRETTEVLLESPDTATHWLSTADKYMQSYAENPTGFFLPAEHLFLKPLVDAYADNLDGFVEYVRGVRDSLPRDSKGWDRVQRFYRKIMSRSVQQSRRERAERAVAKAEELYGRAEFHQRLQWIAKLEHHWAKRRLDFLAERREKTENNRLSVEERAELLEEFWDEIDTEISRGEIPPWN